jgi:hypothetical protein
MMPGVELNEIVDLAGRDADAVGAATCDASGNIYIATGPKGVIFRIKPDKTAEEYARFSEGHIYALALDPQGILFAGTSPDGKIYKIPKAGQTEVWFEPKQKFIWALEWRDNALWAATGTQGKLWRITAAGQGSVVWDSDEPNLRSLFPLKKGGWLIGTEGRGLLVHLDPQNRAEAWFDSGRREIRAITQDAEGRIAFATVGTAPPPSPPKRPKAEAPEPPAPPSAPPAAPSPNPDPSLAAASTSPKTPSAPPPPATATPGPAQETPKIDVAASLPTPRSAAPAAPGGNNDKGDVWLLSEPGNARKLWSGDGLPHTLLRQGADWWIGTGDQGYLFAVNDRGDERSMARVPQRHIVAILDRAGSPVIITSGQPAVFTVNPSPRQGTYDSPIVDSGSFASWGRIALTGHASAIRTRSGNTREPDKLWSPWTPLKKNTSDSPSSRYIQYQIELQSGDSVQAVELFFRTQNRPPELGPILAVPPGIGFTAIPNPIPPPAQQTAQQLVQLLTAPAAASTLPQPKRLAPELRSGLRTIVWNASDPDGDTLRYLIRFQHEQDKTFTLLKEDLTDPVFSFDTTGWRDGRYRFEVVVTDRWSCPDDPRQDQRRSERILVDNTPPRIETLSYSEGKVVVRVVDAASILTVAEISQNGTDYLPALPKDGLLDSDDETFEFSLTSGQRLHLRFEDEAGNITGANAGR